MTAQDGAALETALAYHRAWTGGDFEQAMAYVADDIVCAAPTGRLTGAETFRAFMQPFAQMLASSERGRRPGAEPDRPPGAERGGRGAVTRQPRRRLG